MWSPRSLRLSLPLAAHWSGDRAACGLVYFSREARREGDGMAEQPSGTVTFLFTDLEVSTRLWEEHPEPMQDALARHDAILRDAIAAHGGFVVKGRGDGVHAAFTTARDALAAA